MGVHVKCTCWLDTPTQLLYFTNMRLPWSAQNLHKDTNSGTENGTEHTCLSITNIFTYLCFTIWIFVAWNMLSWLSLSAWFPEFYLCLLLRQHYPLPHLKVRITYFLMDHFILTSQLDENLGKSLPLAYSDSHTIY